ncbi:hypothetical protein XOC_3264 [Xanthomonas oryzae pv. oryzicola BLS256]|uniref:Uncharacterized protein n=1 Tax=Xanthomonas oryzae pv. oryzicola (strain BLS256) TaxID=383407 RepID=G7TBU9_XANOB|nr:hypothetical protein XOC_3264 [Xanthomonas oryzae pv. oryzicola BLS256]
MQERSAEIAPWLVRRILENKSILLDQTEKAAGARLQAKLNYTDRYHHERD